MNNLSKNLFYENNNNIQLWIKQNYNEIKYCRKTKRKNKINLHNNNIKTMIIKIILDPNPMQEYLFYITTYYASRNVKMNHTTNDFMKYLSKDVKKDLIKYYFHIIEMFGKFVIYQIRDMIRIYQINDIRWDLIFLFYYT